MAKGDKRKCDEFCGRDGIVVISEMMPPQKHLGINESWLFEFARCKYHRAWHTRRKKTNAK